MFVFARLFCRMSQGGGRGSSAEGRAIVVLWLVLGVRNPDEDEEKLESMLATALPKPLRGSRSS